MATKRLTRAEQQARTRRRLLDAALAVCVRRGLHAATVEEIAEEAGFTRGAVYSSFGGKDGLLLELFREHCEEPLREIASRTGQVREAAREYVESVGHDDREMVLLLAEFWAYAARNPAVRERFAEFLADQRAAVRAVFHEREKTTRLAEDLPRDDLSTGLVALGVGSWLQSLVDPDLDSTAGAAAVFELVYRGAAPRRSRSARATATDKGSIT